LKVCYLWRAKLGRRNFLHDDPSYINDMIGVFHEKTLQLRAKAEKSQCCCLSEVSEYSEFRVFCQAIAKGLVDYVAVGFDSVKVKRRDIFVSVYQADEAGENLLHVCHEDPRRYKRGLKGVGP